VVWYGVGVLCVRREAMVRALERDFEEIDGGLSWQGGSQFFNVQWGVDYCDGSVVCLSL